MQRTNPDWKTLAYCWAIISAAIFFSSCQCKTEPSDKNSGAVPSPTVDSEKVRTVNPGDADAAIAYYSETLTELGLNPKNLSAGQLVTKTRLSQVMAFLGYPGLDLKDVEDLPSAELMKRFPGDVLSSAFFAPKITDVSVKPINPGWRKLVRFKAKGDALETGISAGYLLFNKFQEDYDKDPFGDGSNESLNTQLILVRAEDSSLKYPVYFFVFHRRSGASRLITFLTATFDARAPNIVAKNRYYVPNACAACHGGLTGEILKPDYEKLKLNYLDTDHWFDRLEDDFAILKDHTCGGTKKPCAVLYDARNDESEFEQAFNVLRELNREIAAQNKSVPPDGSFQLRAVTKWLELHGTDSGHKDVFARALPPAGAGDPWKADNPTDKELLPLLNRYCFRCHSSLKFNIFDRPAVVRRKKDILENMTRALTDEKKMPQDRNLDCSLETLAHKEKILELVRSFPGAAPSPTPKPSPTCPAPTP